MVVMLKQRVDVTTRAKWVQREEKGEELQYGCMLDELDRTFGLHNALFHKAEWLSLELTYPGSFNRVVCRGLTLRFEELAETLNVSPEEKTQHFTQALPKPLR